MGLVSQSRPTNPVLHAIFTLGAALGNEVWNILRIKLETPHCWRCTYARVGTFVIVSRLSPLR